MIDAVPTDEQLARALEPRRLTGAITLPVMGTLVLARCVRCEREVLKRSLGRGRCSRCYGEHKPHARTVARWAQLRSGGACI